MKSNDDLGNVGDLVSLALEKSNSCLGDAKRLQNEGCFDGAVNRAYYSIFWGISCVHLLDGNRFKRHKDAIGIFNKKYVHTGVFPSEYGRKIANAELARHKSDYDILTKATEFTSREHIVFAEQFFQSVEEYCRQRLSEDHSCSQTM